MYTKNKKELKMERWGTPELEQQVDELLEASDIATHALMQIILDRTHDGITD